MTGKKYLSVIVFFLAATTAQPQTLPSDCLCTDQLVKIYRNDAYRIAWKRIFDLGSTYRDSVRIPMDITDSILKNMVLVHNIPASPLRDSVISVFGSRFTGHNYPFGEDSTHIHGQIPRLKYFEVSVQQTAPWVASWLAGNFTATSNAQINQLMSAYNLTAQLVVSVPVSGNWIFGVRSTVNYNTLALKSLFEIIPGVSWANVTVPMGSGCTINYSRSGSKTFLDYRLECGDCPAICLHHRTWYFTIVDSICAAEFIGTNNTIPPAPFSPIDCAVQVPLGGLGAPPAGYIPCSVDDQLITSLPNRPETRRFRSSDFRLAPNPAQNQLTIYFPQAIKKQKQIRITNVQGRLLQEYHINDNNNRFSVGTANLAPGVYYLTVSTYAGTNTILFCKQ